jgi:hypothetical protein
MRNQVPRALVLSALLVGTASAEPDSRRLRAEYDVYTGGIDFLKVEAVMALGPTGYDLDVRYRTVGVIGFLYPGRQQTVVSGGWDRRDPAPTRFHANGRWGGRDYLTLMEYDQGLPTIRGLTPPPGEYREPVPTEQTHGTIDSLTAFIGLMARLARDDRCEAEARLFDGRRLSRITARSAGRETLERSTRSSYAGPAVRCDFEALVLAGFRLSDDAAFRAKPYVGSAWFARPIEAAHPVPVRITFETRALGLARMYLKSIAPDPTPASMAATNAERSGERR